MKTVEAKMVSILREIVPESILCSECTESGERGVVKQSAA